MNETTLGRGGRAPRLPALWFVTDPTRVDDPVAVAETLPRGAGVIYRGFGRPQALQEARSLAAVARRRGLVLLIGLDDRLAARVGADGVHLPERAVAGAPRLRARHPRWILTGAAHDARAIRRAELAGLDGVLVSAVFPSRSPSAGRPLGPVRFARLVAQARTRVFALGGVTAENVGRLKASGAAGVAAVSGIRT